jgi:hypothetical protein
LMLRADLIHRRYCSMSSVSLSGRRILIAGSADPDTPESLLVWTHTLLFKLVTELALRGAAFVVPFGKEPRLSNREDGPSIIFDWGVAEALNTSLANGSIQPSVPSGRLIATVATSKTDSQIPPDRRAIYENLRDREAIHMEFVEPGWTFGAARRQRQAQLGDVLICVSGGQGVEHLAQEFVRNGKHVIPLEIALGSSSRDGAGSSRLYQEALSKPEDFFRLLPNSSPSELLDRIRTCSGSANQDAVVTALLKLIEKLTLARVFYIRLLNADHAGHSNVERFFREVVDPVVTQFGFEPVQMGIGKNEFAWMNDAIFQSLHYSEVAFVDLTGLRQNCFMELGYALGNQQRVIISAMKGTQLPFDSSSLEVYMWDVAKSVAEQQRLLREHWVRNFDMPPLVKPRGLA